MDRLRLLIDPPLDGATNMARDEALLEAVAAHKAPATLRFYAWSTPTISLGYFQAFNEIKSQAAAIRDLPIVRRTTGGGAILHDLEVTYSLVVPAEHAWLRPNANRLYEWAHGAIVAAVGRGAGLFGEGPPSACGDEANLTARAAGAQRGPFFCFARRHALDVVVACASSEARGAAKLVGSAQRRVRGGVLQHGSIILDSRFSQQPCAAWSRLGGPGSFQEAVAKLRAAFEDELEAALEPGEISNEEAARMPALIDKHTSEVWLRRR